MEKITFFLLFFALFCLTCNKNGGCDGELSGSVMDMLHANGASDVADVLQLTKATKGFVVQFNAGINSNKPYNIGLGGSMVDVHSDIYYDTPNEIGKFCIDEEPYNKVRTPDHYGGPSDARKAVHAKFDGLKHRLVLYNLDSTRILMDTVAVVPRSFLLDEAQPQELAELTENGITLNWVGFDPSKQISLLFFIEKSALNQVEKTFFKSYRIPDNGSFTIPKEVYAGFEGNMSNVILMRHISLNADDFRDRTRKNAIVLSTSWGFLVDIK